jgi:hypothetical protein
MMDSFCIRDDDFTLPNPGDQLCCFVYNDLSQIQIKKINESLTTVAANTEIVFDLDERCSGHLNKIISQRKFFTVTTKHRFDSLIVHQWSGDAAPIKLVAILNQFNG